MMGLALDRLRTLLARQLPRRQGRPPPAFLRVAYLSPRQVALVTASYGTAATVWPTDWHIPLSLQPPLYGIAVSRGSFGAELVAKAGCFVVNMAPADWEEVILYCGSVSGREVDKFAATGLVRAPAVKVDVPVLAGALGTLECVLEDTVAAGDHLFFVGRVVHSSETRAGRRLHHLSAALASEAAAFERRP